MGKVMPEKNVSYICYLRILKTVVSTSTPTFSEDPVGAVQPTSWGWAVDESGWLLFAGMVLCEGHPHLGLPATQQLPASLLQESGSALPPGTQESHFDARQAWKLAKKVSSCLITWMGNVWFLQMHDIYMQSIIIGIPNSDVINPFFFFCNLYLLACLTPEWSSAGLTTMKCSTV